MIKTGQNVSCRLKQQFSSVTAGKLSGFRNKKGKQICWDQPNQKKWGKDMCACNLLQQYMIQPAGYM